MKRLYITMRIVVVLYLLLDLAITCNSFSNKLIGNFIPLLVIPILLIFNSDFYQNIEYKNKNLDFVFNFINIVLFIIIISVTMISYK